MVNVMVNVWRIIMIFCEALKGLKGEIFPIPTCMEKKAHLSTTKPHQPELCCVARSFQGFAPSFHKQWNFRKQKTWKPFGESF